MTTLAFVLAILPALALAGSKKVDPADQWPQFRGPLANGVGPKAAPPLRWSETENIRWKIPIPGKGLSTPIVWGDRVYLTTAIPVGDAVEPGEEHDSESHDSGAHDNMVPTHEMQFVVLAIDRRDGTIVWRRTLRSERPHEGTHVTGSWASNTAVTDGKRLYVSFGSRGLFCLDMDGNTLWQKDLGHMMTRHAHGEGSSPALHGETLVVNWDHQGGSFIAAFHARTGKQKWKIDRDEITSWSSPLIVEYGGRTQVIVSATKRVRAYDLADGSLIWECGGLSRNVVASPVAGDGMVYVANSYDWQAMLAIRLDRAKGDITDTDAVVWKIDRHTPYVPSPLLYDGAICFLRHNQGLLSCLDAETGKPRFGPQRLEGIGNVFASPVAAAGRIYIVDRLGTAMVVKHGAPFEVLAVNRLDDSFSASPALAGRELYLRGEHSLYCIAETTEK